MYLDPTKPYIFTIDDVLTADECAAMMERIDRDNPSVAPISTPGGFKMALDVRNNERVIFDDADLAATLVERVRDRVPAEIFGWRLVGTNERFRCYRYKPGMRFAYHSDGAFHRHDREQSFYSFLVYLNAGFEGGATTFLVEPPIAIQPEAGMALLFQHPIVHEGSEVLSGVKYVLRTDLMYRKEGPWS